MFNTRKNAIKQLYEKFWKELYLVAHRRIPVVQDCEDILQDIFISLFNKNIDLSQEESVRSFLHQRLKSRIINYYRRKLIFQSYQEFLGWQADYLIANESSTLASQELELLIMEEIERLPERMKTIFLLSRFELLSSAEIAAQLGLSDQTVRNQIYMALKRIRQAVNRYTQNEIPQPLFNNLLTIALLLAERY